MFIIVTFRVSFNDLSDIIEGNDVPRLLVSQLRSQDHAALIGPSWAYGVETAQNIRDRPTINHIYALGSNLECAIDEFGEEQDDG